MVLWTLRNTSTSSSPPLLHWILSSQRRKVERKSLPYPWGNRGTAERWSPPLVPQTQKGWGTASSGFFFSAFLRTKCVSVSEQRLLFWDKGGEKTKTQRKMPFGGLAGLKEQVLKPGKEEVKNTVGDSLGKLQRWECLYGCMKTVCTGCLIHTPRTE